MRSGPRTPLPAPLMGWLLLIALAAPTLPARAADDQPKPLTKAMAALGDSLPLDAEVKIGKLPNGMTYYIRKNGWPEKRVAIRLAVNAGSVLEDDDQQGFAHLLEHMLFNGTEHFKPGELVRYLESIGSRFGPDLNAYTSFDETVYMLDVPTDQDTLVDKAFLVMSDYAGRATLSDEEINKERGVVLEEWRLGQGADERMARKEYPIMYHGSRYASRLPIGVPEVIQHTPPQRIRDFYQKWYRPERMALVVVGDVDPAKVEEQIRSQFADIPASSQLAELPEYEIPPHEGTLYSIASDPEARYSSIQILYKHPAAEQKIVADYRRSIIQGLIVAMLGQRLDEISKLPNAPFINAYGYFGGMSRTVDTFNLFATVQDGGLARGLETLLTEAERLTRHGFGAAELERAKADVRASYERMYREADKTENSSFAREYVSHFLNGEPIPGLRAEYEYMVQFLPGISLEEVQSVMRTRIHEDNRVIVVESPEKPGLQVPSQADLEAVVANASKKDVAAWVDETPDRPLMGKKPKAGKITGRRTIDAIGVTVLTLSNGMEVWLKPTDFKHDQVLLAATATGGASIAEPAEYLEARYATSIVGEGGIGGFKPVELDKLLAGKLVGGAPSITNYWHGFSGSASPVDLETALQLTYLTFTEPTHRPEAWGVWKSRVKADLANRASDPNSAFGDSVQAVNFMNHYMVRPVTPADVDALDAARAIAFYKDRYGNAADFTFYVIGAFDPGTIEPMIEQYLASLPSKGKPSSKYVDRGYRFTPSSRKVTVRKGIEPKSRTTLSFFADAGIDEMEWYRLNMATNILQIRLREILREEQGGTYSVSVNPAHSQPYLPLGLISIGFGSAPENVDKMVAAVLAEIEKLKAEGPAAEDIQKVSEMDRRGLERSEKQNGYWVGALQMANRMKWDPARIASYRERAGSLTAENLQATFRKYFPMDRYTLVSLFPEKDVATPGSAAGGR
jgi:zinc protease